MDLKDMYEVPTKDTSSACMKISEAEPCKSLDYRYPTMKLFPLLLDTPVDYKQLQVSPSNYLKEMSYSSDERWKELSRGVRQVHSLPEYPSLVHFRVSPSIILFQNSPLHSTTTLAVSVTNSSRVSRHLRMKCEDHPNIKVKYKESAVRKLAAGMTVKFSVEYTVTSPTDYFLKIVFSSDDADTFTVPIIALSPRPILDLPDSIHLPLTPVKVESKKTLMIRNINSCMAVANFLCQRPFRVEPDKICIDPNEMATVSVIFCSRHVGTCKSKITVVFETGEEVVMNVEGSSECGNVYLSSARVDIPQTYMKMKRQGTVSIHNSTDSVLSFQWHLLKSEEDDHLILNKLKDLYQEYEDIEKRKVAKLVEFEMYDEDVHQVICERITRDNINLATSDSLYFYNKCFHIFPLKGEIWPGGVCNISVVFSSEDIGKFESFCFLEIDGMECRLPLCLSASAIGPNIRLNVDSIDAGEIHLLQVFSAKVIVENVGDIVGRVCFIRGASKCGSTVSCSPLCYKLEPGQMRPYLISVSKSSIGVFSEVITFQIDESRVYLNCVIKGVIVEPALEFSEKLIDLGSVPLGFELVKTIRLINKSKLGFGFRLEITGYWEEEAVKAWDLLPVPKHPKEFSVFPSDGLIKPYGQLEIKIVSLLNHRNRGESSLKLSVWDNTIDKLTLPISYSVSKISVRSLTPEIFVNFAFINYAYKREINIVNDSDGTAFYSIFAEDPNLAVDCQIEENNGVILPYGEKTIHISLKVVQPGKQRARILLKTFGAEYAVLLCVVTIKGIHPVLNLEPVEQLDMGEVVMLVPTRNSFSIVNVSPIATEYSIAIEKGRPGSGCRLSKESGEIEGNSKEEIGVMIRLKDPGPFEDIVTITSPGSELRLKIVGIGIGCAIVTVPSLCPSLNLGNLISSIVHEIEVLIINKSSSTHELLWSTCENLNNWTKTVTDENQGDHFKIIPYRMTLKPGQKEKLKLTAYCDEEKLVEESYFCVGISGVKAASQASHCRKTLGESLIFASFINPHLKISKNEINFCVRVAPDDPFPPPPTETVRVTPEFKQEMVLEARVKPPFKMLREDGLLLEHTSIQVVNGSPLDLTLMFDTSFRTDCYSWSADASLLFTYKNHPSKAILALHGEVQYPNIVLNCHMIDFGGIHKYSEAYRQIVMRNMSPYDVHFSWEWSEHTIRFLETPRQRSEEMLEEKKESTVECIHGKSMTKIKSSSSMSKMQSFASALIQPEDHGDRQSVIKEILNVMIYEGPFPEDCELDEEEMMALKDVASLIRNNQPLLDKFTHLLLSGFVSPPASGSEPMFSLVPAKFIHSAIAAVQKLQEMVIKEELLDSFQDAVVPFLNKYIEKQMFEPLTPVMSVSPHDTQASISKLIDFTPKWGVLLSGQQQVIGCSFKPKEEVEVDALALCKIYGGPTEKVSVKGICAQAKYSFPSLIDFGFIHFCEINTREWKVNNECCINIVFRVIKNSDVISIEPIDGYLKANSEFCFRVMCLPGTPGPFESHFFFELGTLEVAKIVVKGMAMMSQVILDLPEKESEMPIELFYKGIASITDPVFKTPLVKRPSSTSSTRSRLHDSSYGSHLVPHKASELNGFQLIGYSCCQDEVPSLIDIKMALERELMITCVDGAESILKQHAGSKLLKHKFFTDCILAAYQLDFGSVIFDTRVEKTVQVYNYGYLDAQVTLSLYGNEEDLESRGITFKWEELCSIEAGSVGSFTVTLHPSSIFYPGSFYNVKQNFVLQVACGATIPVEMRVYFVQPELSIKNLLEFGEMKCGQTKYLPLTLYNIGTVNAEWTLTMRVVKRKRNDCSVATYTDNSPCPFFSNKEMGLIAPGKMDTIVINFLPSKHGVYERVLEVRLNQSRATPRCKLRGTAIEPYINLNQLVLDFGTVFPYSAIYEQDITVHNPCPFPLQVSLIDYDRETEVENRVLRALCSYYNTERMQLPLKYFDTSLSPQVKLMYNSMARLGAFLKLSKVQSNIDSIISDDDLGKKFAKNKSGTPAKPGIGKVASAKGIRKKSRLKSRRSSNSSLEEKSDLDNYLADRTLEEIDDLVNDYIEWLQNIPENDLLDCELMERMNLKSDLIGIHEDDDAKKYSFPWMDKSIFMCQEEPEVKEPFRRGTLVIFYGAPYTEYDYLAHKSARNLCLKPVTLDSIILEEAAYSHTPASLLIRQIISNTYEAVQAAKRAEQAKLNEDNAKYLPQTQFFAEHSRSFPDADTKSVGSMASESEGKTESDSIIDAQEDLEIKIKTILDHMAEEARKRAEEAALEATLASLNKKDKPKKAKDKPSKSEKSTATKSTKESNKNSKKDLVEDANLQSDTFLDIGMENIHQLIAHRVKLDMFDKGIVVDNLTGLFIKNAVKSLEMLLNIAGPTKNIFFVNVFHSYEAMNILRENQKKLEEMRVLKNAEDLVWRLKVGSGDNKVKRMSRKECFEALDLYHNTGVKIRNDMIMEKLAAEELVMKEVEPSTVTFITTKSTTSKMKNTTSGTSQMTSHTVSGISSPSSTKAKSQKSSEKSKQQPETKKKGKKKIEVEVPEEEVIPPEELELMAQFKHYSDNLAKIFCLLENHDRLKVEEIIDKGSSAKRISIKSAARKGSRSGQHFSVVSTLSKGQSKEKIKPMASKDPMAPHPILICSQAGDETDPNVGVPLIIVNNANITTQLQFFSQISGLKTIIPLNIAENLKVPSKVHTDSELNNKSFWYDKPELLKVEKPAKVFRIENKGSSQSMLRKDTGLLIRVKPQTSMPAVKELQPKSQEVRRISPLMNMPLLSVYKKIPTKLFRKKTAREEVSVNDLETRKTLEMGNLLSWTVAFYPEEVGRFKHDIRIGITGWPKSIVTVRVEGTVQLPDLNRKPQSIFPLVVETVEDVARQACFVKDKNMFDFGFVFTYIESSDMNNSVMAKFKLTNPYKVTVNVNLSLNTGTQFELEPNEMSFKPGETRWLLVECNPKVEGFIQDQLFCCIQNNPDPFIIQLCCTAVKGEITVKPKEILFDKVLLKHNTTKTLVLSNLCGLRLFWNIKPIEDISKSLVCSMNSGYIDPFSRVLIHFSYKAFEVEVLDKSVTLQVYNKGLDEGGVVIQTILLPVRGESYDVIVNMCFPEALSKQLDFGDIKVETEHTRFFVLENKGLYEIEFKIELENFQQELHYTPSDIFRVSVSEGILSPKSKQPFKVQVTVRCLDELLLEHVPMLKIILFEKTNHIANLSVPVSLSSHYTKFRLVPKDEVGFGSVLVGETKVLFLTIENTGYFEFKYFIVSKAELDHIMNTHQKEDRISEEVATVHHQSQVSSSSAVSGTELDANTNHTKTPDHKSKKPLQPDKKQVGPFVVHGVSGIVKRDMAVKIKITCSPDKEANFKEVILIQASELPEAIRYGFPVNLLASGCLPNIDFSNTSLMYRDAIVVSNTIRPEESNGMPVVVYKEESGLIFQNVVVSTTRSMKIYLQNTGMVSSTVKIRIQAGGSVRAEYFSVDPNVLHITAYATEQFNLHFSPTSIELSETVLEMELEVPYSKPVVHKVALSGRGCLPIVELISPIQVKSCVKSDKSVIDMGTCLLDFHLSNILTFRNPGICYCKFILELTTESDKNFFSLAPLPQCKHSVNSIDSGRNERLSCGLSPGEEVQLSCVFAPTEASVCLSTIKVLIVDNPYEQYRIQLYGKGYMDNVTIEGLPFLIDAINMSVLTLKIGKMGKGYTGNMSNCSYLLDFGQSYIDRPVKQELKLRNHSDNWVRFSWDVNQLGVSFYPRLGCIPPNNSMIVYSILLSHVPTRHTKLNVKCNLEKVVLDDSCAAWNSHEKLVAWLRHEDKYLQRYDVYCNIEENEDEPVYLEVVKLGELKLQVQLETDRPSIQPDIHHIVFPDTLICQGNSRIVKMKNVSRVEDMVQCNVVITKAFPSNCEAAAVFSTGKLQNNELYPNTGQYEEDSSASTSSINVSTKAKPVVSGNSCKSEMYDWRDKRDVMSARTTDELRSCPFTVIPESFSLLPGKVADIEILFKPMQMFSYSAKIMFLLDGVEEKNWPSIDVEATGLTSYCHLEINDVDIDLSGRNVPDDTKVILMDCIGIPATYNKKFSVINPTDKSYNFEWIKCERDEDASFQHVCATPSGLILAHKSYDMEFNFLSVEEGKFEKMWLLRIVEMEMEQHILFITCVREPLVKFSSPTLNLKPTIAGMRVIDETCLLNEENIEIKFKVDKCSLFSEGRYEKLEIEPTSGVISPHSVFPLRVIFNAKRAGDMNFMVGIQLSKKKEPIWLRVTSCCFSVEAVVTVCPEGSSHPLQLTSDKKTLINLGHMELKVPRRVEIKIRNSGRAGFYVELSRREDKNAWKKSCLQLDHETKTGFICPGTSSSLYLTFSATAKSSFNNLPFTIKIVKGPEYEVLFSGDAAAPEYSFSFTKYEFGHRFIQTSDESYNTAELIFKNEDEVSIEVEKLFKDTEIFKVELEYSVVPPRSTLMILIKFMPRQIIAYSNELEFLVNGIYSTIIYLSGSGVPLKVELVRPKDKLIDFGAVLTGQTVCRAIEVINRSERTAAIHLVMRQTSKENYHVNVKPKQLVIGVDRMAKLNVSYTPHKRGVNMTEKVWFECEDHTEMLVVTEGRGVAAELRLDRDMIPFGLAVVGSTNPVKLALINSGDFGTRFVWDFSKACDCFKISPKDGYSTPGSILTFDVSFTPRTSTPRTVRNQVLCNVENWKTPLSLVLTGSCADIPPPKDFIRFVCPVRQKISKSVPIFNHTSEKWVIYPTISGDCFSGEGMITILPRMTGRYDITFSPTAMAKKKNNHEGSLFFAYPDGQSILFGLKGQADAPNSDEPVSWTTPAKKQFVGKIPIRNWLADQSQRFTVEIKARGEGMKHINKNLYKIFGNAQIDVAPSATRLYDVHFFSYLSTTLTFTVNYTNEVDGEYGWLELSVDVTEAEVLESYNLETEVRKRTDLHLMFNNPTDSKQTLTCDGGDHRLSTNTPLTLPPKHTGKIIVSYFPVLEEEGQEEKLLIKSSGLGEFCYKVELTARPPPLPPPVTLTASLGRNQAHTFTVTNHTPADANFNVQVESKSLICPKVVKVRPLSSEAIIVLYEPFSEMTENVILTASSDQAGIFKFPMCLTGTAPAPRGPYEIRPGSTLSLNFKNIFHEAKEFIMTSESEFFVVKNPRKQIKSKQDGEFVVQMMKREEMVKGEKLKWSDGVIASKLIVSPADASLSHHCWLYYIRSNLTSEPKTH